MTPEQFERSAVGHFSSQPEDLSRFSRFSRQEEQGETAVKPELKLPEEALSGVVGDITRSLAPHTEADEAAVLIQLLVAAGNIIGRTAHYCVESDTHHTNLFAVLVGTSSKGRKGTSWGHVQRILEHVDGSWASERIQSGLSSGEGLIWSCRDAVGEKQPIKRGGRVQGYELVETDPGVEDKRLLAMEPEFGRVLTVCERESNTLSAVIRQSFDSGNIRTMTKKQSAKATGAHISICAHVTQDELLRLLTDTQSGNGFANRYLWALVKRSKLLPEGGAFRDVDIEPFVAQLKDSVQFARTVGELRKDAAATELWAQVYPSLSAERSGLVGSLTSRAEALTMRLALLYAVLDTSPSIKVRHLAAALAVWSYCQASAEVIFGDTIGDPVADAILTNLRQRPEGMSRSELVNLFNRHKSKSQIDRALQALENLGWVAHSKVETGGRPLTVWTSTRTEAKWTT